MSEIDVRAAITRAHREEWARVVATLARRFGNLDIAEEMTADAFATAVKRWPVDGPAFQTARTIAVDHWGMDPCEGDVDISWGELPVDQNAVSTWINPFRDFGDPAHNAQVVRSVFGGETGAVRDAVLLNAGLALALTGTDSGSSADEFETDVRAGMARAAEAVDSGAATRLVGSWVAATRSG